MAVLQFESFGQKAKSVEELEYLNPFFYGSMSSIVPGSGQLFQRKYIKSPLYFVTISGFTALSFIMWKKTDDKYKEIVYTKGFDSDSEANRKIVDDFMLYRRVARIGTVTGGVLYILNILDSIYDAHLYNKELHKRKAGGKSVKQSLNFDKSSAEYKITFNF
jgi:hypothetical protein